MRVVGGLAVLLLLVVVVRVVGVGRVLLLLLVVRSLAPVVAVHLGHLGVRLVALFLSLVLVFLLLLHAVGVECQRAGDVAVGVCGGKRPGWGRGAHNMTPEERNPDQCNRKTSSYKRIVHVYDAALRNVLILLSIDLYSPRTTFVFKCVTRTLNINVT